MGTIPTLIAPSSLNTQTVSVVDSTSSYSGQPSGGSLDVLEILSGDLDWETIVGTPTQKTFTVGGDGSGDIATGSLHFTGDGLDGFKLVAFQREGYAGETLDTPWYPDIDGDFYFAMNDGERMVFVFEPVYGDGSTKEMTIQVLRGDSTVDGEIVASQTWPDPFLGACSDVVGLIALYSPRDWATIPDTLVNGDSPFVDISGNAEPDLTITGTPDQQTVVASGIPNCASLQNCVRADAPAGNGPFGDKGTHLGSAPLGGAPNAGIVVFKTPDSNHHVGWVPQFLCATGLRAGQPLSYPVDTFLWLGTSSTAVEGWINYSSGYLAGYVYWNPYGQWMTYAWAKIGTTLYAWFSLIGGAFGGLATGPGVAVGAWNARDGFTIFPGHDNVPVIDNLRIAGAAVFSAASAAELEAIHDSIPVPV